MLRTDSDLRDGCSCSAWSYILILCAAPVCSDKFWFWTIDYAGNSMAALVRAQSGATHFCSARANEVVLTGLASLDTGGNRSAYGSLGSAACVPAHCFSLGFLFFSALAVCPGFYFRHALLRPCSAGSIACLLARQSANSTAILERRRILIRLRARSFLLSRSERCQSCWTKNSSSRFSPNQACGLIYPGQSVSGICSDWHLSCANTPNRDDTIAVLGSGTRDLFLFPSAFGDRIHLHLRVNGAAKIRAADAGGDDSARSNARVRSYLVSVAIDYSWLRRPGSDRLIFTWANEYMAQNYAAAGFVNITLGYETEYLLRRRSDDQWRL